MSEQSTQSIIAKLLNSEEFSISLGQQPNIVGPIHEAAVALLLKATSELNKKKKRLWFIHSSPRFRDQLVSEAPLWDLNIQHFPDQNEAISDQQLIDPETSALRLEILQLLSHAQEATQIITLSAESLEFQVPNKSKLEDLTIFLKVGESINLEALEKKLESHLYQKVPQVHERGQWAIRGGIVDIFGWQSVHPVRIELFDVEIDSIREFDLHSQISRRRKQEAEIILAEPEPNVRLKSFISKQDLVVSYGEDPHPLAKLHFSTGPKVNHLGEQDYSSAAQSTPLPQFSAGDFVMQENQRKLFTKQIETWKQDGWSIYLFFASEGELGRFNELLGNKFQKQYSISFITGALQSGICIPAIKTALLSSSQLFGRSAVNSRGNSQLNHQRRAQAQTDLEDIKGGDLVVHSEYGIGRFKQIAVNEDGLEEIHIRFRDNVILSVPIDHSYLLSRYVGIGGKAPQLSKLGDGKWTKAKATAEKAILDYAAQLLQVQAERQNRQGEPHPPDGKWMHEFESSFPYQETQGQLESIEDAKADMESNKPMDRLICGDVGFGKTEVAIRAIFKAVAGGKQAAVLVPTTVLAEQHWRNFQERMSHFPVRIELLNRFRSAKEIKSTLEGLNNGSVDVVVGTHRLVSDDVTFKRLGLVVIDEEQRFGVKHKEKFKQRFNHIDVLTLSATPIPRTLYLSLMGARDMSTIDTAPPNKVPVQTSIAGYDNSIIKDAILREIARGGQIFFLHNRVKSIEMMKDNIAKLVPKAKIVVGHGQMEKNQLETVMSTFIKGEADILLSTTIIESGIDIPNANTIIIDRADRFGLADLYQLRGRVGRGGQKAYAILLIPKDLMSGDAKRRMQAIQQYTALGSGFKIAMRDLEIRGAGNLLGTKQSGHITTVGFDLYCQLLKQSIDRLQGNVIIQRVDVLLRIDFIHFNEGEEKTGTIPCYIPSAYMPDAKMRIQAYKNLATSTHVKRLKQLKVEWKDRYGKIPTSVKHLLDVTSLKIAAAQANISIIEIKSQKLILTRNGQLIQLEGKRFPRLTETHPEKKLRESIQMLRSI